MLHIHFGAGRLGLGLVAPFFRRPGSELYLLNRSAGGARPSASTSLSPERRNELLLRHPERHYFVRERNGGDAPHAVRYDRFLAYDEPGVADAVGAIVRDSSQARAGVVVTASVLGHENYRPVLQALNALSDDRARGRVGAIFLIACENGISARDVLEHEELRAELAAETRGQVTCVHALVDRVCSDLEEDRSTPHPTVAVRAEPYGSLKLELQPETEPLVELCRGSRVEFTRHVDAERQIKSWLVNGTHSLIALTAFQEVDGNPELKLNDYLNSSPAHRAFAEAAMKEMCEGVAILLRKDPKYAAFVRDVDVDRYLEGAAAVILRRFCSTEDSLKRILSRFRAPNASDVGTIEEFNKRFGDRIDEPVEAYIAERGVAPPAISQSLFSLHRLIASGMFVDRSPALAAR
jgi:hypothetical protein